MGNHNHHGHCQHALAFCERCDRPYCVKCNREWYAYSYYPTWYTYTTPYVTYGGATTTTSTAFTLDYEGSDHSGH